MTSAELVAATREWLDGGRRWSPEGTYGDDGQRCMVLALARTRTAHDLTWDVYKDVIAAVCDVIRDWYGYHASTPGTIGRWQDQSEVGWEDVNLVLKVTEERLTA